MPITETPIPVETAAPTDESSLWMLEGIFRASWEQKITNVTSFETSVVGGLTTSEMRAGLRGQGTRRVRQAFQSHNAEQLRDLRSMAMRAVQCRSLVPLTSDFAELTAAVGEDATVLNCDTTDRRGFNSPPFRAVIHSPTSEAEAPLFDVVTVVGADATSVTIDDDELSRGYPAGSILIPLIEAEILSRGGASADTAAVSRLVLDAGESVGVGQLAPLLSIGDMPEASEIIGEYNGLPVFIPSVDYGQQVQWSVERVLDLSPQGITNVPAAQGERGRWGLTLPHVCDTRALAFELIKLFESRGGRLFPLYVVSPMHEFTVLDVLDDGEGLELRIAGSVRDWDFVPLMTVILRDGTLFIRPFTVERGGGVDTITFTTPIDDVALADIERVAVCYLMRFAKDELVEEWFTNKVMLTTLDFVELLQEKSIESEDIEVLTSSDLTQAFVPGNCSGDPFLRPNGLIYYEYRTGLPGEDPPYGELGGPCSPVFGGNWWQCLNSTTHDGNDITGKYVGFVGATTLELTLTPRADPLVNTDHVVRIRLADPFSAGNEITCWLKQGDAVIATILFEYDPTNSIYDTIEYTLTGPEADSITDYSKLRIRFESTGSNASGIRVNHWSMQIPPPP